MTQILGTRTLETMASAKLAIANILDFDGSESRDDRAQLLAELLEALAVLADERATEATNFEGNHAFDEVVDCAAYEWTEDPRPLLQKILGSDQSATAKAEAQATHDQIKKLQKGAPVQALPLLRKQWEALRGSAKLV